MYNINRVVGLPRDLTSMYMDVDDAATTPVYELFNTYRELYIEVTTQYTNTPYILDGYSVLLQSPAYQGTLQEYLDNLGDTTLPTVDSFPSMVLKRVYYYDYLHKGYKAIATNMGKHYPSNYPKADLNDIQVQVGDPALIDRQYLFTVNGYLHWTEHDKDYVYIENGNKNALYFKQNQLGILDCSDFGTISKHKFIPDNITIGDTTVPVPERILINTEYDFTGKAWCMSLGGYLVFPENDVLWQYNNTSIMMDLTKLDYLNKILESSLFIDYSDIGLDKNGVIDLDTAKDIVWLRKWLTTPHTFLIVFEDMESIKHRKYKIKDTNLPGMFVSYFEPRLPLMTGHGRLAEYWSVYEDGMWAVNVVDNFRRPFIVNTANGEELLLNRIDPRYANDLAPGYFLEIYQNT